jgi:hypothetical protein
MSITYGCKDSTFTLLQTTCYNYFLPDEGLKFPLPGVDVSISYLIVYDETPAIGESSDIHSQINAIS